MSKQVDLSEAHQLIRLVEADDARLGIAPKRRRKPPQVAWLIAKAPFLGGEYYRATRPALLAANRLGWGTCVGLQLGTVKGEPRIAVQAIGGHVMFPDVLVVRPIGKATENSQRSLAEMIERAHEAGQLVVADLDDDVWAHEDWTPESRPDDDEYETWCWDADAWLVSTEPIARRVASLLRRDVPVVVAPNVFDAPATCRPVPGRRIGTRLWLSGRMSADRALYEELYGPWLELHDLTFVHLGADDDGPRFDFPRNRLLELPSTDLLTMRETLAATLSIGAICVADHPYNRAKTLTHPVELAGAGLPMVVAMALSLDDEVPGKVEPTPSAVWGRLVELLDHDRWQAESDIARAWAAEQAIGAETAYLGAIDDLAARLGI